MMTIELEQAKFEDLNIRNLSQRAYNAFEEYWQGSEEEFYEYMKNHNLDYDFEVNNINELGLKTDKFLNDFSEAVKKDISKFDFRLSSSMTSRNIKPIELDDYVKITLKNDELNTKDIYDTFLSFNSRSFIDFRSYNEQDNTLTFIYNRRGIFDENDRIAILKAKNSATMSDNFKSAKDNNFILSGLCHELAEKNNIGFRFEYLGTGDVVKEISMSADNILNVAEKKEAKKEEAIEDIRVEQIAREELIKERATTRQSLSEDSNKHEILKEANTEIRLNVGNEINLNTLDKVVDDSISMYKKKEEEKLRIRLETAQKEGIVAYKEMQERIAKDGMNIYEAINYTKQKYREEHTVNMASAFLTKDILEVGILKTDLANKEESIKNLNEDLNALNDEITKREETISSLKSTLQNKQIEITNLGIKHEQQIEILTKEAQKKYKELDEAYSTEIKKVKNELDEKDTELEEQDDLILRLNSQIELLKSQLNTENVKNENLIRENESLKTKLGLKHDKIEEILNSNNQKDRLDNKDIDELKDILKDEKQSNSNKREALASMRFEDILREDDNNDKSETNTNIKKQR